MTNLMDRRISVRSILTGTLVTASLLIGVAVFGDQPKMENALSSLRTARQLLVDAKANKGGHRANAIKLIDQAIDEVKAGIAAAE